MAKNKRRMNEANAGAAANRLNTEVAEELGAAEVQQQINQANQQANQANQANRRNN